MLINETDCQITHFSDCNHQRNEKTTVKVSSTLIFPLSRENTKEQKKKNKASMG